MQTPTACASSSLHAAGLSDLDLHAQRAFDERLYQTMTVAAILLVLGSVWIF